MVQEAEAGAEAEAEADAEAGAEAEAEADEDEDEDEDEEGAVAVAPSWASFGGVLHASSDARSGARARAGERGMAARGYHHRSFCRRRG